MGSLSRGARENARSGVCQPIRETTRSLFGIPSKEQSSVSVISVVAESDTPISAVLTGPDPQTAALIEDLRREISALRDQLDIQTFELEKLRRRQRELYDDLDARLRQEERITASMPTPGEGGSAPVRWYPQSLHSLLRYLRVLVSQAVVLRKLRLLVPVAMHQMRRQARLPIQMKAQRTQSLWEVPSRQRQRRDKF